MNFQTDSKWKSPGAGRRVNVEAETELGLLYTTTETFGGKANAQR